MLYLESTTLNSLRTLIESLGWPAAVASTRFIRRGGASVLLCLCIGWCGAALGGEGLKTLDEPRIVPGFELPGIDGRTYRLSDYQGSHVLVNFWAVWCTPCRREMPSLERLHRVLGGKRLQMISVHVGPSVEKAGEVAGEFGLSFPVIVDEEMTLTSWGVRGLPTSFLLDPDGRVIAQAIGDREWDSVDMVQAIRQLLVLLPEAGHLAMESAMIDALVGETNRFRVSEARRCSGS